MSDVIKQGLVAMPKGTRCYACIAKAAELVISDASNTQRIAFCLSCAKQCAKDIKLPGLAEAIAQHERGKS